jgi:hypothetical protein
MKRNERGIARSDMIHMTMCMLSGQRDEVPEVVVRRLGLREAAVGLVLGRMDQVGKLDRVLDEEDRDVVADDVPVALLGVELHGEAAHVAGEVERALVAGDGGEAHEGGVFSPARWKMSARVRSERLVGLEVAVRAEAARVHDALGDALVVEVEDLLAEMEVLQQRGPAGADPSMSSGRRRRAPSRVVRRGPSPVPIWCVSPPRPVRCVCADGASVR